MDLETKFDLILKELKNICAQIDERFEQVDKRFEQIDERFEQIDKRFEQIDERFEQIDERFEKLENKFDNLSKEVGALNRTLFKLDVDTQEKFSTLFEANETHDDKELIFEKQLSRLHDSLDNTTSRVALLENAAVNS